MVAMGVAIFLRNPVVGSMLVGGTGCYPMKRGLRDVSV